MISNWPCPQVGGGYGDELAIVLGEARPHRVLIVAPLFDEANKLRRLLVEVMRRLDGAGVGAMLPDMPGVNESLAPLAEQTLAGWQHAAAVAASHFAATHVLAVRSGALIAPRLPGWHYAPLAGSAVLRQLLRARIVAAREAGREETSEALTRAAEREGIELGGYPLGAALFGELLTAVPDGAAAARALAHTDIGGTAPWLRAEPGFSAEQADALAATLVMELRA